MILFINPHHLVTQTEGLTLYLPHASLEEGPKKRNHSRISFCIWVPVAHPEEHLIIWQYLSSFMHYKPVQHFPVLSNSQSIHLKSKTGQKTRIQFIVVFLLNPQSPRLSSVFTCLHCNILRKNPWHINVTQWPCGKWVPLFKKHYSTECYIKSSKPESGLANESSAQSSC